MRRPCPLAVVAGLAALVSAAGAAPERRAAEPLSAPAPVPLEIPAAGLSAPLSAPLAPPAEAAAAAPGAAPLDLAGFAHVVFDVRGSRGGQGDVAASYLTASDMLERSAGSAPEMTFVADPAEFAILSRLSGRKVFDGERILDGKVRVVASGSLDGLRPAELYLRLAAPHGGLGRRLLRAQDQPGAGRVPIARGGVALNQTVLGNTESRGGGPAEIVAGGYSLLHRSAGLAPGEAGIYADPVARRLKDLPRKEVGRFLLSELAGSPSPKLAGLAALVDGRALAGADVALAYGVSMSRLGADTKSQFRGYLRGLRAEAAATGRSFAIVTPSNFGPADVSWWRDFPLWRRVTFLDPAQPMPARARPGRLYIVRTGILPHPVFVGVMKYSAAPPVVAGDGAMSAAIGLSRDFAMTRVPWNRDNAAAFADRLDSGAPGRDRLIDRVFRRGRLRGALGLGAMADRFTAASRAIPVLTDSLLAAARSAKAFLDPATPLPVVLHGLPDGYLRASVVAERALRGDAAARYRARVWVKSRTEEGRLVAWALTRAAARRWPRLRQFAGEGDAWVHKLASRLALWLTALKPLPAPAHAF